MSHSLVILNSTFHEPINSTIGPFSTEEEAYEKGFQILVKAEEAEMVGDLYKLIEYDETYKTAKEAVRDYQDCLGPSAYFHVYPALGVGQ